MGSLSDIERPADPRTSAIGRAFFFELYNQLQEDGRDLEINRDNLERAMRQAMDDEEFPNLGREIRFDGQQCYELPEMLADLNLLIRRENHLIKYYMSPKTYRSIRQRETERGDQIPCGDETKKYAERVASILKENDPARWEKRYTRY